MSAASERTATAARHLLAVAAGGAMLVMMILTCVDVIGRYGFNNSIFGASEMIELLMVAAVFGGLAFVTSSDDHIYVSLFDHLFVARMPKMMAWLKFLFSLAIYGILVWVLWRMAIGAWQEGRATIVLALPLWLFSGLAALLSTGGFVIYIATAASQLRSVGTPP